jgi:polysaccharide biosynthesis transport protein
VFRVTGQVETLLQMDCIGLVPLKKQEDEHSATRDREVDTNPSGVIDAPFSRFAEAIRKYISGSLNKLIKPPSVIGQEARSNKVRDSALSRNSKKDRSSAGSRVIARDNSVRWAVFDAPFSRYAEAIRAIKLAIDLNEVIKANKVIGFTSSLPNEGKSTIAVALAQLISQAGGRAILIDCDLRNPSLTRALSPEANAGIIEVISGKMSLDETVWQEPSSKLTFLPAVVKSRLAHSNEILSSAAMTKLFAQLRERYDYIVADLSPLAPIVDVRATTHFVDSYIVVIEWGQTKIDVVKHALSGARAVHENVLGVVLNKVDMDVFGRYEGHHRNYYFNKNYERYGYTE